MFESNVCQVVMAGRRRHQRALRAWLVPGPGIRRVLLMFVVACWSVGSAPAAAPTEVRAWNAKSGHKVEARAMQVTAGKVHLERADGTTIDVDLDKFSEADQAMLREHFALANAPAASGTPATPVTPVAVAAAADDLPHPLGKITSEISCGDGYSCYLYFPNSLRKGVKHPVLYVMSPGGGSEGDVRHYQAGAERNRWIIAVSTQSKNGFDGSQKAVDAMIKHVTGTFPIDKKRMYTTGFSGGSRMAFATAGKNKDITGVIACGAGGNLGSAKQVAYGLCGSNCFNRTDMANSFRGFKGKDCVLRYFPGQHDWANEELCDDGITHLNGVYLCANRSGYKDDYAFFVQQVSALIENSVASAPLRAYLWTTFLTNHGVTDPKVVSTHATLGKSETNKLYMKGLSDVGEFAQKTFGGISASQWQADPKIAAACVKEAKKYPGTPWEDILERMSKDAQKF